VRVAIVHDWLSGMRGGEKCLEVFCELFPQADLYTLIHQPGAVSPTIEAMRIHTSFIQYLPAGKQKYPRYLPLMPLAVEAWDLREYDFILSSSHCVAKGAIPGPKALHVCYCHTPMRYIWDRYWDYFGSQRLGRPSRIFTALVAHYLRMWDVSSSTRVDYFIANSQFVQRRIWRYYRRRAEVIPPPVDTQTFTLSTRDEGYFLMVTALVPYKRVDMALEAFRHLKDRLVVVGSGSELRRLKRQAPPNVEFVGWQPQEDLVRLYQGCRALIFPGVEDFGIVPLEAQACGKPVIALGAGGVLESVRGRWVHPQSEVSSGDLSPGKDLAVEEGSFTGLFFSQATPQALIEAVRTFYQMEFDPEAIRANALRFDREVFKERIQQFLKKVLSGEESPWERSDEQTS